MYLFILHTRLGCKEFANFCNNSMVPKDLQWDRLPCDFPSALGLRLKLLGDRSVLGRTLQPAGQDFLSGHPPCLLVGKVTEFCFDMKVSSSRKSDLGSDPFFTPPMLFSREDCKDISTPSDHLKEATPTLWRRKASLQSGLLSVH